MGVLHTYLGNEACWLVTALGEALNVMNVRGDYVCACCFYLWRCRISGEAVRHGTVSAGYRHTTEWAAYILNGNMWPAVWLWFPVGVPKRASRLLIFKVLWRRQLTVPEIWMAAPRDGSALAGNGLTGKQAFFI